MNFRSRRSEKLRQDSWLRLERRALADKKNVNLLSAFVKTFKYLFELNIVGSVN